MCGICGFLGFKSDTLLERMLKSMRHRGPDERGTFEDPHVTLGHARLSIIDLEGGRQPIFNERKDLVLLINGEIYNFQELRHSLQQKGHVFSSRSDSEVAIHAYEEYGEHFLEKLTGMFGLAIWDIPRKKLLLARDRLGIKPLYYYWKNGRFLFASEFKGIIQDFSIDKEMNLHGLFNTMTFRFSQYPHTPLKHVKKISPGHFLVLQNGEIRFSRYWEPSFSEQSTDFESTRESFRQTLRGAVKSHLVADVPLGIMLSGGIDSSALVAFAAENLSKVKTFSIGFQGQKDNEFAYARMVAEKFGTEHLEITVQPENIRFLPHIVWYNDEPIGGPSSLAYFLMLQEARKHATVILFGHGADEVLGGYEQLKILKMTTHLRQIPPFQPLSHLFAQTVTRLFPQDYVFNRLQDFTRDLHNPVESYLNLMTVINPHELPFFFRPGLENSMKQYWQDTRDLVADAFKKSKKLVNRILSFEMGGWLSDDINHRLDRITMSASIEARVPFLDHPFVEFAGAMHTRFKVHGYTDKYMLREAMRGILPDKVIDRPKQRFNTPIDHFFGTAFDRLLERLISEKNFLNDHFFDTAILKNLMCYKQRLSYQYVLRRQKLTAQFYSRPLWNYVILQLWYKMFLENSSPESLESLVI